MILMVCVVIVVNLTEGAGFTGWMESRISGGIIVNFSLCADGTRNMEACGGGIIGIKAAGRTGGAGG